MMKDGGEVLLGVVEFPVLSVFGGDWLGSDPLPVYRGCGEGDPQPPFPRAQ